MSEYIKKKGTVLQVKPLEKWTSPDKKEYFVFGVFIKYGNSPKETDAGKYFSPTKEQTFFLEGQDVEYQFKANKQEPKDSRIKPFTEEKKSSNTGALNIQDYVARKKVDAVSFSASYAKDILVVNPEKSFTQIAEQMLRWQLDKLNEL